MAIHFRSVHQIAVIRIATRALLFTVHHLIFTSPPHISLLPTEYYSIFLPMLLLEYIIPAMGSEAGSHELHVLFIPFLAQGHMIPMFDMAKLFAHRPAVKASIATTPSNASVFQKAADRTLRSGGPPIHIHTIHHASLTSVLPNGAESINPDASLDSVIEFLNALAVLKEPLDRLLQQLRPHCIVSDTFVPWTFDVAAKHKIPRLCFNGSSFLSMCVWESIARHSPHVNVTSNTEPFLLPGIPHDIETTRAQTPEISGFTEFWARTKEADRQSLGVVLNSFYELEVEFADYYRRETGRKAWQVGPVSLSNSDSVEQQAERGKQSSITHEECRSWLDAKEPSSVIYICYGSLCKMEAPQLAEIALALEESPHPFIWVVGNNQNEAFEAERVKGKGLIIRGWAPQVVILSHPAIAVFITHCGWNSIMESVSAGVAMITWPLFAEQFYNEKLITRVLEIGVGVGAEVGAFWDGQEEMANRRMIKREKIGKAIERLMGDGEEAKAMRKRARDLGELAKRAVEAGGSSYLSLSSLLEELSVYA